MGLNLGKKNGNPFMRQAFSGQAGVKATTTRNILDLDMTGRNPAQGTMTVDGAVNKSILLFAIMIAAAGVGFLFPNMLFVWGGILGGAGIMFWASRSLEKSNILAPIYAVLEGLFVGSITAMYGAMFDGIVFNAVLLTLAVFLMMLLIYKTGIIKVTPNFRAGVSMAVGAVMIVYLISIVGHFIGFEIPFLHSGGLLGIGISVVIIGIASLNLLLDFDNFDKGADARLPEHMEWFFSMGLLFTVIWLYVEILRLLAILASSD